MKTKVVNIKCVEAQIERVQKLVQTKQQQCDSLEEQLSNLDKQLAQRFIEDTEWSKKIHDSAEHYTEEIEVLAKMLKAQLEIREKQKERENMLAEDRSEVVRECNVLTSLINDTAKRIEAKKSGIIEIRKGLFECVVVQKAKMEEKAMLQKEHDELSWKLKQQLEREARVFEEDLNLEYAIHKMKGKLYSIFILEQGPEKSRLTCDSIELKVPGKESCWTQIKFDCVVSAQLDLREDFSYPSYLYSYTLLTLRDNIDKCTEQVVDTKAQKEVLYLVLGMNNKFGKVKAYISHLLEKLKEVFEPAPSVEDPTISVSIIAPGTSPKVVAANSFISGETIIKDSMKLIHSLINNGNAFMKIIIRSGDKELKLVFAFANTKDSAGIEEIKLCAREAAQNKSAKRSLIKDCENMQHLLCNVRTGYLLVVCDQFINEGLYELLQAAHFIEEHVPCMRSEVSIPTSSNSIKPLQSFYQQIAFGRYCLYIQQLILVNAFSSQFFFYSIKVGWIWISIMT
eukprot:TRINITY_DN1915_c0_g1_i1.p3 TRINITY_DN1915_c0_g1~~TRINITY_DN1915_c0_g1_i1.p3  ORF type:complete len:511 (+),score=66.96 TRINITY_DN1915_c0_g1_i1:3213-4745(+)